MANLLILAVHLPGQSQGLLGGFVLISDDGDDCEVAFRTDWEYSASGADAEVLNSMPETLEQMVTELGSVDFVSKLEDTLSNTIRCTEQWHIATDQTLIEHARVLRASLLGQHPTT